MVLIHVIQERYTYTHIDTIRADINTGRKTDRHEDRSQYSSQTGCPPAVQEEILQLLGQEKTAKLHGLESGRVNKTKSMFQIMRKKVKYIQED